MVSTGNSHTKFLSAFRYNLPPLFNSNYLFPFLEVATVPAISLVLLLRDWALYGRNIADTSHFFFFFKSICSDKCLCLEVSDMSIFYAVCALLYFGTYITGFAIFSQNVYFYCIW